MMRVIINGALGHMGREVAKKVRAGYLASELAGEADASATPLGDITARADVIIDFSNHAATAELLAFATARGIPVVIATTGQTEDELALIREAARQLPVFLSANMSLGIAVLMDVAKRAAAAFPSADIEIVETHHNRKLDAPSGTALLLADGLRAVRAGAAPRLGRRPGLHEPGEIPIHSLRMGDVVGEHRIYIDNGSERLELTHTATSRALFAEGAIACAAFLIGKPAGLYGMEDVVKL
ncbi:MAG: 4-hydroxy-tetrahydrodipicolinate reductase [Clostridiales Family XIII bacterium]|jgi:4-hydroxy-tetrahydrodipicolinate reductase|nr:4-hydroxy-tetrahydrodipicolinate reductase [Clostridiales Family XIII bacterium]